MVAVEYEAKLDGTPMVPFGDHWAVEPAGNCCWLASVGAFSMAEAFRAAAGPTCTSGRDVSAGNPVCG